MDAFILTLGWLGIFTPLALGASLIPMTDTVTVPIPLWPLFRSMAS